MSDNSYVLITPARNEESFIEKTIQSVLSQTVLPKRWVIVNDNSIDRTAKIVDKYSIKYDFIEHINVANDTNRNFGSKAIAISHGYEKLKDLNYDYIGNLDADILLPTSYYENILTKFRSNNKLGVAGGVRYDLCNGKITKMRSWRNSVAGAIQLFRRQCYESIDGYTPQKNGGIDAVAEIMARMHGWEVVSFPEYEVCHCRQTGTVNRGILKARFHAGIRDYYIGYHPLFHIVRCLYRITNKPFAIGSLCSFLGYYSAFLKREKRSVSNDFVNYFQKEQLIRLISLFKAR